MVQIFLLVNLQAREKYEGQNSKVCSGGVTSPDLASGGRRGGGGEEEEREEDEDADKNKDEDGDETFFRIELW